MDVENKIPQKKVGELQFIQWEWGNRSLHLLGYWELLFVMVLCAKYQFRRWFIYALIYARYRVAFVTLDSLLMT